MRESRRSWSGAFFGLLLLLAGFAGTYITAGHMVAGYVTSMNWVEVPATLRRIEFVRNYDKKDLTSTYKLDGAFTYKVDGLEYRSNRISIVFGSDNIGSFWADLYHKLVAQYHADTVIAFVNPENPSDAVLDRTIRSGHLIFGFAFLTLFGGTGTFFLTASLRVSKPVRSHHTHANATRGPIIKTNPVVVKTDRYVDVVGGVKRNTGLAIFCIICGVLLAVVGRLMLADGWGPGFVFMMIGILLAATPLFLMARRLDVRFDRQTGVLYMRQTWFGLVSLTNRGKLTGPREISLQQVLTTREHGELVECFVLLFHPGGQTGGKAARKTYRISGWIEGRRYADGLRKRLIRHCFDEDSWSQAA